MNYHYCAKCNSQTNSTYFIRQLGFLCGKCTKEHGEKEIEELNKEKDKINKQMQDIKKQINDAIIADCKHENAFDTNYGHVTKEGFVTIWRCPDCDFTFGKLHELKVR